MDVAGLTETSTMVSAGATLHRRIRAAAVHLVVVGAVLSLLPQPTRSRVFSTQMSPNIVETQYGRLRGLLITLPQRAMPPVEAYFGIQYASLQGGDLRFMPPTSSMEKWDGVRVFHKFKPVCPQRLPDIERLLRDSPTGRVDHIKRLLPYLDKQHEECLYLNIYVPVREKNESSSFDHMSGSSSAGSQSQQQAFPVVVFIHGESYDSGTGNAYDGSVMAAFGHVIVVTLNYRLGPLGFLSTGDSNAAGNYAILDQVAALHWIKENIRSFSGDPNSVTLLGHGFGASLVNLLLVSPVTRGRNLFHRAIIHGGSALSTWSMTSEPLTYARQLAERVNCTGGGDSPGVATSSIVHTADMLNCLKLKPADELVNVDIRAPKYQTAFGPTVDRHSVLPYDVHRLMMGNKLAGGGSAPPMPGGGLLDSVFGSIRLLVGLSRSDAALYVRQRDLDEGMSLDRWRRLLRTFVQNSYSYHRQYIYDVLAHQYTDWDRASDDSSTRRDCLVDLLGDALYVAPGVELAQRHSALQSSSSPASTYVYSFAYNGGGSSGSGSGSSSAAGAGRNSASAAAASITYNEDMSYAFGAPITDGLDPFSAASYSRGDKLFSETVLKYWTNFIKTGNPNEPRSRTKTRGSGEVEWPAFDLDVQQMLQFERKTQDRLDDGVRISIGHHYRGSKMALWLELIPKLHKSDNLDPRYHQLDHWDNLTTFEEQGTRHTSLNDLLSTTSTTTKTTAVPIVQTSTSTTPPTTTLSHLRRPTSTARSRKVTVPMTSSGDVAQSQASSSSSSTLDGATSGKDVNTLSLSVTIAVGSFLLFLNILIFVAVYYQKDRIRQERRRRKAEMASIHQQEESMDRRDSAASEVKSNVSFGPGTSYIPHNSYAFQQQSETGSTSALHQTLLRHNNQQHHIPPAPPPHGATIGRNSSRDSAGSYQNCNTLPSRLFQQQQQQQQQQSSANNSPSSVSNLPNGQLPQQQQLSVGTAALYGTMRPTHSVSPGAIQTSSSPGAAAVIGGAQSHNNWSRSESTSPSSYGGGGVTEPGEGRRNGGLPSAAAVSSGGCRRLSGMLSSSGSAPATADATELQMTGVSPSGGYEMVGRNPTTIV